MVALRVLVARLSFIVLSRVLQRNHACHMIMVVVICNNGDLTDFAVDGRSKTTWASARCVRVEGTQSNMPVLAFILRHC
jgi:hypothetical protein